MGLLGDIGQGLQLAGGVYSPQVFQDNQAQILQQKKFNQRAAMDQYQLKAQSIIQGMQNGTIDPQQGSQALQGMGINLPPMQQKPSDKADAMVLDFIQKGGNIKDVPPALAAQSPLAQRTLNEANQMKGLNTQTAPPMRKIIQNDQFIQQEMQPDGTWKTVGSGPRSTTNIDTAMGSQAKANPDGTPLTPQQQKDQYYATLSKFGFSRGGSDAAVYNRIINGKYPQGGRGMAIIPRNAAIDNLAAALSQEAGITPEQMATIPAQKKAQAAALLKQTQKYVAIDGILESFHNNIQSWEQIAQGMPPTMAGPVSQDVAKQFKKIDLSGVRSVNDARNKIAAQFNDPSTVAYLTAAYTVAMDYARVMSSQGQSAAQITDSAMAEATKLIPAGLNDNARKALVTQLLADTNGQRVGVATSIDRIKSKLGLLGNNQTADPLGIR